MPYVAINVVLDRKIRAGEDYSIPYPVGKNKGSFFGTFNHTLAVEDHFYRAPNDFIVVPEEDRLVLHWRAARQLQPESILYLQIEEMGRSFYYDQLTGVTVQNMVISSLYLVNLKTPHAPATDYYMKPKFIRSGGTLTPGHDMPDVARSVTITSTADDSSRNFRVEGEDMYFRTVIEDIKGPNAGTIEGRKAFYKIQRIVVDGACKGEISIGSGLNLGLPVFLPAPGYVMKEIIKGAKPKKKGHFEAGEAGVPSPVSGDRRGTYRPHESVKLDGRTPIHLLLSLANPGNIGSPDFTG